jgi:pimeloyl-ACP methyl ester carboxylesterase
VFGDAEKEDTLLLVHCWSCNRAYWKNQIPDLAKTFRVVTLDLPGHGDSSTKREQWTLRAITEEIAAVVSELKLDKFVVVGHSMGGPLALQLAAMMPGNVEGVVCIDTLHNVEFDFKSEDYNMTEETFEKNLLEFIPLMLHPNSDKNLASWLVDQSRKTNRKVALSLWEEFDRADFAAMMSNAKVPIRCVNAVPYNEMSYKTEVDINRKYGDYEVILMKNVGHFPMLERPEEFTELLKKAIRQTSSSDREKISQPGDSNKVFHN